jgi:hypothetical protein
MISLRFLVSFANKVLKGLPPLFGLDLTQLNHAMAASRSGC